MTRTASSGCTALTTAASRPAVPLPERISTSCSVPKTGFNLGLIVCSRSFVSWLRWPIIGWLIVRCTLGGIGVGPGMRRNVCSGSMTESPFVSEYDLYSIADMNVLSISSLKFLFFNIVGLFVNNWGYFRVMKGNVLAMLIIRLINGVLIEGCLEKYDGLAKIGALLNKQPPRHK